MNKERIQQVFYELFTCESKEEETAAIKELLSLGLTTDQIESGILAGSRYIKRKAGLNEMAITKHVGASSLCQQSKQSRETRHVH